MDSSGVIPPGSLEPTAPGSSTLGAVAPPVIAARFMLHLKTHGLVYAVGWLVLDASGTWAAVTGHAAGMCG